MTDTMSALDLAAQGLHPFPCDHPDQPHCIGRHSPTSPCDGTRGKHPAVKWGVWAVTVTPQMIDLEWRKHGGLVNTAISCGPSNIVVFDEDEFGELARWCAAHGVTLPDTYTVSTGRGCHYYFRWDQTAQRIGNVPKAVRGYKLDVRGDGGFVIAEGSRHESGAVYTSNGHPIADLPPEVAEILLAAGATSTEDEPGPQQFWDHTPRDHANTMIAFGERHPALVAYAGRLRKSGLDYREAEPTFRVRWLLCEQPEGQIPEARFHNAGCPYPVTWPEAQAKLRDVFDRYPAGDNLNHTDEPTGGRNEDGTADHHHDDPGQGTYTDSGNAARLVAAHRSQGCYIPENGMWLRWNSTDWHPEPDAGATEYQARTLANTIQIPRRT